MSLGAALLVVALGTGVTTTALPQRTLVLPRAAAACYTAAYPDQVCGNDGENLRFCDGSKLPLDDGRSHESFEALLDEADLLDQLAVPYPAGPRYEIPIPLNQDPGRARHLPFFYKIYGTDAASVRRKLVRVPWISGSKKSFQVTTTSRVSERLARVVEEVERLPERLRRLVRASSGGFKWRAIAGTKRLSAHSFGIAIDVGGKNADYWRWSRTPIGGPIVYRNRIPSEVVEIFERHGFIWGGKWYHYDTMHFEYRPELLVPECRPERLSATAKE